MLIALALIACTKDDPAIDDTGPRDSGGLDACEKPPNLVTSPDQDCFGYPDATDCDCDGFSMAEDCDDRNSYTFPGADDIPYNGVDDDCAGDGDMVDFDADGYDSVQAGGDDCNDANKDIFPGAEEVCYNGIDENCDGLEDTDDCDGDGYPGIGDDKTDCDDRDPDRNPGVEEIWYDGIDQNCTGTASDYDADLDGDDSSSEPDSDGVVGTDCDDEDPLTAGGNPELLDNKDRDCDGVVDVLNSRDAAAWWSGTVGVEDGFLGYSTAVLEDYDGDGYRSVAIGGFGLPTEGNANPGRVYILDVGDGGGKPHELATASIDGVQGDYLGAAMDNIGDLDGDGLSELLVSAPVTDSVSYLFDGATIAAGGALGTGDAIASLVGSGVYTGFDVVAVGDVDNDGVSDLAVSTAWAGATYGSNTYTAVFSGADAMLGGRLTSVSALAEITGAGNDGGHSLGEVDLDGDGVPELLFPDYTATGGNGALAVAWGDEMDGFIGVVDDMDWIRGANGDEIGVTTGWYDDMDGNGYPEILVRAYGAAGNAATGGGGRIYLVNSNEITRGQGNLTRVTDQAFGTIEGTVDYGHVQTPETQGDFDGDGVDDIFVMHAGDRAIVNPAFLEGEPARAAGYILQASDVSGGGSIAADLRADEHLIDGWKDDELTGYSMQIADLDGDGLDDFLLGSPVASGSGATRAGNAHVLLSYLDEDYTGL